MTYEEFREALRKTERKWELRAAVEIRLHVPGKGYFCPLEAVLNVASGHITIGTLGRKLNMDNDLAYTIAAGADYLSEVRTGSMKIRQDLLSDCGLAETS